MTVDCAVVAALPRELDRVRHHFRYSKKIEHQDQVYVESMTPSGVTLVAAVAAGMGQVQSAILLHQVVKAYQPKTIILVGIAAGVDRSAVNLGDVVISDQIVDYSLAKITEKGVERRWSVYPVDQKLLARVRNYTDTSWRDYIQVRRPGDDASLPQAVTGLYLSGNSVVANAKFVDELRSTWRKAAALEMEGAAIAASLRAMPNPPGFITIKGICDYADASKNDGWQEYAADAAASFAYSFVTEQLRPDDVVWPHRGSASSGDSHDMQAIRVALMGAFDLSELKVLCIDLSIDWDEIAGQRKSERIADLLLYSKRHSRLADLISYVNEQRAGLLRQYAGG